MCFIRPRIQHRVISSARKKRSETIECKPERRQGQTFQLTGFLFTIDQDAPFVSVATLSLRRFCFFNAGGLAKSTAENLIAGKA
jgi:hypothetical protein